MIDQQLIDTMQDDLDFDIEIDRGLVKELLTNYIKVIEDNAVIHKQSVKYKTLIEDVAALGFLEPSFDSGKSHKDVCKKFKELFQDDEL